MANTKVFIVTKSALASRYNEFVLKDVIPSRRNSVVVLEEEAFGIGGAPQNSHDFENAAKKIADVIDDADADNNSQLLIDRKVKASHKKLRCRWQESGKDSSQVYVQSEQRVAEKLKKIVINLGIQWKAYALSQLERYIGQSIPLDDWCGQFSNLKISYLGRRLSMQLQVVSLRDGDRPFAPRRHESFGQKVLHCFVNDGDHGGSWIGIKDELSHDIPEGLVKEIQGKSGAFGLPDCEADEIVIYEDGLWSGSETIKRLRLIKESGCLKSIRFKYAVVTDFGLMVARQAIRFFELQSVVKIDASDARFECFLGRDVPEHLAYGHQMEPEIYFEALHQCIGQRAFNNPDDWPEGLNAARRDARELGCQLVRNWYEKDRPDDDVEIGMEKFCMGGGGFASTMTFPRSVPKVCLPVFWLAGPVTLNGVSMEWTPLFLDARRIDPKLLLIG